MVNVRKGAGVVVVLSLLLTVIFLGTYVATAASGPAQTTLSEDSDTVVQANDNESVTVQVFNQSGSLIPNAEVEINMSGTTVVSGVTDSLGKFDTEVANGTYNVTARAGGYEPNTTTAEIPDDDNSTLVKVLLNRSSGTTVGLVDFELKVVGRHTGCALDASYDITNIGDVPYSESGTTGLDGRVETKLPVKVDSSGNIVGTDYQLTVNKPNYDKLQQNRTIDSDIRADVRLDPTKGNISVTVEGQKVDSMEPLENATVAVEGHCFNSQGLAFHERKYLTNETGEVDIKKLPPADYTVNVTKFGYESSTDAVSISPGSVRSLTANLDLLEPSNISAKVKEHLNFTLTKNESQPLEDANVTFHDLQDGDNWTRTTNSSGIARLENLPPGRYVAEMNKSEEEKRGATLGWSKDRNATVLTIGEAANITGTLIRNKSLIDTTAVLKGKFIWTRRNKTLNLTGPAKDYLFKLKHIETGTLVNLTTDDAGGLAEGLPTGAYEIWTEESVEWTPAKRALLRTHIVGPGTDGSSGDAASPAKLRLDNKKSWNKTTGVVLVPKLGTALLKVYHVINDPVAQSGTYDRRVENATVEIEDSRGHSFEVETDEHGRAIFPRIHPGDATVDIQKTGYNQKITTVSVKEWSKGISARDALAGSFNITDVEREVSVDGGGSFDFTIEEYNMKTGEYEDNGGKVLIAHTDDDYEERYDTIVEDGESVGPFPPGDYEVYFQGEADDETAEFPACNDEYVVGNKTQQPGPITFQFGDGTLGGDPTTVPAELVLRDSVTNEPIETQGVTDVETTYKYYPDACNPTSSSEGTVTYQTGSLGEDLDEPRFKKQYIGETPDIKIQNPGPLDQPYAATTDTVSFPFGFEFIFHMNPNSARATGQVINATNNSKAVPNAKVRVGRLGDSTTATGAYSVPGIPNGTFEMSFSKEGYYSNITNISVTVPPGSTEKVVDKPTDQPVELEPLPEPKVNVEKPMFGTFLEGVPFKFDWNVTISDWKLETSRPGGDDQIESVTHYVKIDGKDKVLRSDSLNLGPDDLPKNYTLTLDPAELTENLDLGEVKDVEEFYVVVETRKQGEIRYPKKDATGVDPQVSVINMPEWLSVTHQLTRVPKDFLVEALHESSGVPKDLIDEVVVKKENELYIDFTGELAESRDEPILLNDIITGTVPDFTAMGGMRFHPYSPPNKDSANYDFGYRMDLGAQTFPAGDKLLQKTGIGSIGMPMVNLEGDLNGTAYGEIDNKKVPPRPEYESDSGVSLGGGTFVSADGRVIPFSPPISGGLKLDYSESGNADLPDGNTSYGAQLSGEGNVSASLDSLTFHLGKSVPVNVGADILFNFQGEVNGTGPGLAGAGNPMLFTGGNDKVWNDTGNLTVGLGVTAEAGWSGLLSVGQRLGVKGNLTEFRVEKPVFSGLRGRFTLSHSVSVLTIGGKKKWADFAPFRLKYTSGSPSTVTFTEEQDPRFKVNRYWTRVSGYDDIRSWSGNGTLVRKAHPHANPRISVDEGGEAHLVAGHDRASMPVAEGLKLRYFNGSASTLDSRESSFTGVNGSFTPAVAAGNGTQWVGFAKFERYDDIPADIVSSEVYYATRSDGEWSNPVRVTRNSYTESYVRVDSCGPDRAALLWNADRTSLESVDDIGLRYAVVNDTGVVRGPVTVEAEGVRGEASIACHGDMATIAYPVAGATNNPDPMSLVNPDSTVVVRHATPGGLSNTETLGSGTETEAISTGNGTALVAYLDGTQGVVGYGTVKNGSMTEKGTVTRSSVSDISFAEGPENYTVLAWSRGSGSGSRDAVEYTSYNGTEWGETFSAVEEVGVNRSWLSAASDTENRTLYLASMESQTTAPILDERIVNVTVDAVELVTELFSEPLTRDFSSPPTNTKQLDPELYEDLSGDGDGTDVTQTVRVFGELVRGNDLNLTERQVEKLDWDEDSPPDKLTPSDMVSLFGEQIRAK